MEKEQNVLNIRASKKALDIIYAVLIFVLGLLLVLLRSANEILSYVFGSLFILIAVISLILDITSKKKTITSTAPVAISLFAMGLIAIIYKLPIEQFIVYCLIVLGSYLLIEMIIDIAMKRDKKLLIIKGIVGIVIITLAVLYLSIKDFRNVLFIIIGILLMAFAVVRLTLIIADLVRKNDSYNML